MLDLVSSLKKKDDVVLAVSAHADDVELACGATIKKLTDGGARVHHVVLSLREKATPDSFTPEQIAEELYAANQELGIPRERVILHDLPNRTFPEQRQAILDILYSLGKELQPTLVLAPSFDDMHQDHMTLAYECFRAFKNASIFAYEMPWNRITTHATGYCANTEEELSSKIKALNLFVSQTAQRSFFDEKYIRALATTRGLQIKAEYAESFEIVRLAF
jgi:LmbE family N-acetylglucosaminyl deacetylase